MKPLRIIKAAFCAALVCLLLTGCQERENLKDLSVVEGIGIDYVNGQVGITAQTLNLMKEGTGPEALSGNMTMVSSGQADNISSAVENISHRLSKKLYFAQNRIVVFGMDYAENHLKESFDYLLRSANSRPDVFVCISSGEAKDIIEIEEPNSLVPAQTISDLLEEGEKRGTSVTVTVNELLNYYTDKTTDIYLPVVESGSEGAFATGIAVFNSDRLVRVLKGDECTGFMILSGKIKEGIIIFNDDNFGRVTAEITKEKTKARACYENGKVVLKADIKADIILDEVENGMQNSISKEDAHQIALSAERKLQQLCEAAFKACTESSSDCLRIGEMLAKYDPSAYKMLSESKAYLSNCTLEINASCNIKKISDNSNGA